MKLLLERIKQGDVLVGDGALGTMLLAEGVKPGQCPESVNLERADLLEDIAARYLDAGAEVIQTNTFGGSSLKLASYGLAGQVERINRNAVRAVRRAVGDRAYVAGSCGPSGKLLKPYGDTEPDEVYDSFREQIEALVAEGVEAICVETMVDLAEATLAIRAAKDVSPGTPVMATMTFDPTPKGFHTIMGVGVEQAARGLADAGADLVGSNCGNGIEKMVEVAKGFRKCSEVPVIIQANAGLPQIKDGVTVYEETPQFMADNAQELVAVGVSIIGGCCGTTPEHIRALREMVDSTAPRR